MDAISSVHMPIQVSYNKCIGVRVNPNPTTASLDVTCSTECETTFTSYFNAWTSGACANDPVAAHFRKYIEVQLKSDAFECSKSSAGKYCFLDLNDFWQVYVAAQYNTPVSNKTLLCSEWSRSQLMDIWH